MDILDSILSETGPYHELETTIDAGASRLIMRDQLAKFRVRYPHLDLAPVLAYCIERERLEILLLLLEAGVKPDDLVVEVAARSEDPIFLAPLLDKGWSIDQPLGTMPPLLR